MGKPTNPPLTPPRRGTGQPVRLPSREGLGVGSWSQCISKRNRGAPWTARIPSASSHRKRRRTAALQDAGALAI